MGLRTPPLVPMSSKEPIGLHGIRKFSVCWLATELFHSSLLCPFLIKGVNAERPLDRAWWIHSRQMYG